MLINCTAYQHGRKLADLPVEDISDYLQQPDTFVWVALKDATPGELAVMKEEFGLHELAVEDANHGHQRPKVEEYDDELFAVMHLVEEREGSLEVGEVHVFVGPNYILSVRNNSNRDFLGVRARCEREPKMLAKGSGYVFYALMDAVVDRYFPLIEKLETEVETLEERIFTKGAARSNIRRLYRLKRKVTLLKHAVLPLMEAAGKLHSGRVPEVCAKSRHYFRDVTTTSPASTRRSTASATPSARRSRWTCRWSPSTRPRSASASRPGRASSPWRRPSPASGA